MNLTGGLGDLTRRAFLARTSFGAALTALVAPAESEAQQSRRYELKRSSPINLDSIRFVQIFREGYTPSSLDLARQSARLRALNKPFSPVPAESYQQILVKIEPDFKYAEKLNAEAGKSIDDIFEFLPSGYFQKPDLNFKAPKSAGEIEFVNGSHYVHVVADIAIRTTVKYKELSNSPQKFLVFMSTLAIPGVEGRIETDSSGNGTEFTAFSPPILYTSTAGIVDLISSPPTGALYRAVRKYTIANIYRDAKDKGTSGKLDRAYVVELAPKHSRREELFVHAITMLWLRDYNKKTKLGISGQELNNGFLRFEQIVDYKGINQLSQRISQIGIPRAIEMYIGNPDALFNGIPN